MAERFLGWTQSARARQYATRIESMDREFRAGKQLSTLNSVFGQGTEVDLIARRSFREQSLL
jgi:hypothetical protein